MPEPKTPQFAFDLIERKGTELFNLSTQRRVDLEKRLAPGVIDGLGNDLSIAVGKQNAAARSNSSKIAATSTQDGSLKHGNKLVSDARKTLRVHFGAKPEILDRFGFNQKIKAHSVSSTCGVLDTTLHACKTEPEIARQAGILPEDVAEMETVLAELTAANSAQESKKLDVKVATSEKRAAHLRIQEAMKKIYAVAQLTYRGDPETLKLFTNCMPKAHKPKGSKDEKTETPAKTE
jgi:hypothetical protein